MTFTCVGEGPSASAVSEPEPREPPLEARGVIACHRRYAADVVGVLQDSLLELLLEHLRTVLNCGIASEQHVLEQ